MQQQHSRRGQAERQGLSQNEEIVLQALSIFTPITSGLLALEHQLYALAELLPRPIFKQFRKLRDDFEAVVSLVSAYSSSEPQFIDQKDGYLQEQIKVMQAQVNRKQSTRERPSQSRSRGGVELRRAGSQELEAQRRAELLAKEVESLKNELRRNDSEYEVEIKKYNFKYQEMQEEIDYYRRESQRAEQYAEVIEGLQVELRAMQQARERDQKLIQNMAWKLRNLERERYGRAAFLSPKSSQPAFNSSFSRIHTQYSPKNHLHSRDE